MNRILWGALAILIACFAISSCRAAPRRAYSYDAGQIVAHPSGCPWSAFCGCGASAKVYGHPVRELYLASNWYLFPRTSPHAGAAAVWPHHVAILESGSDGGTALAYDANSGGHLTRIHRISLAGAAIVQPGGEIRVSNGRGYHEGNHSRRVAGANDYASAGFEASDGPGSQRFH